MENKIMKIGVVMFVIFGAILIVISLIGLDNAPVSETTTTLKETTTLIPDEEKVAVASLNVSSVSGQKKKLIPMTV